MVDQFFDIAYLTLLPIRALLPCVIAVIVLTLAGMVALAAVSAGVEFKSRRFRWLGALSFTRPLERVALACSWLRFAFVVVFVVSLQTLGVYHYFVFIALWVVSLALGSTLRRLPWRVLWFFLQGLELLVTNVVCGYVQAYDVGVWGYVLYGLMALFMVLVSAYLLVSELGDISAGRRNDVSILIKERQA